MSLKQQVFWLLTVSLVLVSAVATASTSSAESARTNPNNKIDLTILESLEANGHVEFILFLTDQADLSEAKYLTTKGEKGVFVYDRLTQVARESQSAIIDYLESQGAKYRSYWVANMIWVKGDNQLLEVLASRTDVANLYSNPKIESNLPVPGGVFNEVQVIETVEWNIRRIRAPEVWALGFTGQNVVIGGQDTGYDWTHPALQGQYRGWDGQSASHDYNWYDAIHTGGGACGADSGEPCDDHGHGTHTMGIMVGDDGGDRKIAVAPGAQWIGCRNMDRGIGTPITYSECYEWFIAPTDVKGNNPDPLKAPHIINNSWSCPPSEGCTDTNELKTVVENVRAAGILTVHAAGNEGNKIPRCGTINTPAAIYDASFTVGATTVADIIAVFSSRGPAIVAGVTNLKPDVVAPGQNVYSSLRGGGYGTKSGTSMAAPHVAGLAALAISADPSLAGDIDKLELFITLMAIPKSSPESCGGISGTQIPNNTYGYGRIDALGTIQILISSKIFFPIFTPGPNLPSYQVNRWL